MINSILEMKTIFYLFSDKELRSLLNRIYNKSTALTENSVNLILKLKIKIQTNIFILMKFYLLFL